MSVASMRRLLSCGALLWIAAAPAAAQVEVEVRLEKTQYLAGEPVIVLVDVHNAGVEAVTYSACDAQVRLAVAKASRRIIPNIFGCFSGRGSAGVCGEGHPPRLQPGRTTTFRHLLKEYDLPPGQYALTASGKTGVRWPGHPDRPVPGTQFERTLPLRVAPATERELRAALAPLVGAADDKDPVDRYRARDAIVESAPPFLEPLIARLATEGTHGAVGALGRIASKASRTHLKNLFRTSPASWRPGIVLTLARVGHRDDAAFLASVVENGSLDEQSRRYAALGLGYIGGDRAVEQLASSLATAPANLRPTIATALGNSRSRQAVPALIGMFGNNTARAEVCAGLTTLTHRTWCDGSAGDPAATRRKWLRAWRENGSKTVFGTDNCPVVDTARQLGPPPEPIPELQALSRSSTAPSTTVADPGSAATIIDVAELQLTGISPLRPHPAQLVQVSIGTPAQAGDYVQLTDARGTQWRIPTGADGLEVLLTLPDDVADGPASIRVERIVNGAPRLSAPLAFDITSGPLPLGPAAAGGMKPVAPGQWTDLVVDHEIEFELDRADRVEVEFRQSGVTEIAQTTGPDNVHVRVPARLRAGPVSVRTRTWIERTVSEWSAPVTWTLLGRAVPPAITSIEAGPYRNLVWWHGDSGPAVARARAGEALVLRGHFPVANAAALRVFLRAMLRTVELQPTDVDGGVRVALPRDVASGDWHLIVATRKPATPPQQITTVRVR